MRLGTITVRVLERIEALNTNPSPFLLSVCLVGQTQGGSGMHYDAQRIAVDEQTWGRVKVGDNFALELI